MQQNIYTYVAKRIQPFLLNRTGAGYGGAYDLYNNYNRLQAAILKEPFFYDLASFLLFYVYGL